tara:strand:- start:1507 stop:1818 length:312 start_codon:yes stop_codon:yes gene_type:complete
MVFRWKLLKVHGDSMVPILRNGDYIVAKKIKLGDKIKKGDYVEVSHPDFGSILKVVKSLNKKYIRIEGISPLSADSDQIGQIPYSNISARALFCISKRGIIRL